MSLRTLLFLVLVAALPAFGPAPAAAAQPASVAAAEGVRAAVHGALAAQHPARAAGLDVRVVRTERDLSDAVILDVLLPPAGVVPRGHTQVGLRLRTADGTQTEAWALVYVAHYDSVLVAATDLPAGAALTADAVAPAWMETTRLAGTPLAAGALDRGEVLYARRRLAAGRLLRTDDVRPPYAVEAGGAVRMHFRRKAFVLTLGCKARETGFVGEVVRLYSEDTGTTYRARITAPGVAEWIETL